MIANLRGSCFDEGQDLPRVRGYRRVDREPLKREVRALWAAGVHCGYCHRWLVGSQVTVDHIYPLGKGGAKHIKNYAPACAHCQKIKADRMVYEANWPGMKLTKKILTKCLGAGRWPDPAWDEVRAAGLPVGVMVFNVAVVQVLYRMGLEPFGERLRDWPLPGREVRGRHAPASAMNEAE